MRAIHHHLVPAVLLVVAVALLSLNAAAPGTPRAMASGARMALDADTATATATATPVPAGPTTAPPELSLTESFTYTTEACLIPNVTITLGIVNTGGVNTPADTTLTVSLSNLADRTADYAG